MVIIHCISSLAIGGAEQLLVDLIRTLEKTSGKSITHYVVAFHDGPHRQTLEKMGVSVWLMQGLFCLYDPVFMGKMWYRIKILKPDVIHSSLWAANLISRFIGMMQGIPVIATIHARTNRGTMQTNSQFRSWCDRLVSWRNTQVVTVAPSMIPLIRKELSYVPALSIQSITNGIDIPHIYRIMHENLQKRSVYSLTHHEFIIGCVGSLVPVKNHTHLIRVFARVVCWYPQVRLMIMGDGPLKKHLQEYAQQLGIEQHIIWITHTPLYAWYPLLDIVVSTAYSEGLSIALLEAMAAKKACIVTSAYDTNKKLHHEVIENEITGLVVPIDDDKRLYAAIERLIEDKNLRSVLEMNAYQEVNQLFSIEKTAANYFKLYSQLAQARKI